MAVAVGAATRVLVLAAAGVLLFDPEPGSIPGCHRHQTIGITTRRLQRGGDFITYDTSS